MSFLGEVLSGFNNNMMILSVFVDLRNSFDTVPHDLIIRKLKKLHLDDAVLNWFLSFLMAHRSKQKVVISNCESQWVPLVFGMPQGSPNVDLEINGELFERCVSSSFLVLPLMKESTLMPTSMIYILS